MLIFYCFNYFLIFYYISIRFVFCQKNLSMSIFFQDWQTQIFHHSIFIFFCWKFPTTKGNVMEKVNFDCVTIAPPFTKETCQIAKNYALFNSFIYIVTMHLIFFRQHNFVSRNVGQHFKTI